MPRRLDVENFPVGVINNEEHIKRLKEDRPHAEEVAGPNRRRVLLEERAPTRRRLPIPRSIRGRGCRRRSNISCCRRQMFSTTKDARSLTWGFRCQEVFFVRTSFLVLGSVLR
jgi:hypothetical protein